MKFKKITLLLLPLLWLGAACTQNTQTSTTNHPDVQELAFTTIKQGTVSYDQAAPKLLLIESQAAFDQAWASDVVTNLLPRPEAPQIDFTKQNILMAFAGQKTSGGYRLTITDINTNSVTGSNDIVIYASQTSPAAGVFTSQALTSPAHIVSVDKSSNFDTQAVYMVLRDEKLQSQQIIQAQRFP